MPLSRTPLCIVLALFAVAVLCSCGGKRHVERSAGPITDTPFTIFNGEYENTNAMLQSPPRSVAVLPFSGGGGAWDTLPREDDPRVVVRQGMYRHLAALPYRDAELHEVDERLANAGFTSDDEILTALEQSPRRIGAALGVDAVVTGEVTHFDRAYAGLVSQVSVGCTARMVRLSDGKLLWQASHVSREFGGGVSISPVGLVMGAFSSLWNLRGVQLLRETDELFREMVATIAVPESPLAVRSRPPDIELFAVPGAEHTFRDGEPITFRLVGEPKCSAYASLGSLQASIPMHPVPATQRQILRGQLLSAVRDRQRAADMEPTPELLADALEHIDALEIYEGVWLPDSGIETRGVTARGYLLDARGAQAVAVAAMRVAVDTAAPQPPQDLHAEPLPQGASLRWAASNSTDTASYEVWASRQGQTGFEPVASVTDTTAVIRGLADFVPAFLRVRAVDSAGNVSGYSPPVRTIPEPQPGIIDAAATSPDLGGSVSGLLFLPAERGPYSVTAPLVVEKGAALHIGPGALVRFAPDTGLTVRGTLATHGTQDAPVFLVPNSTSARPGTWAGVSLDGAEGVRMSATRILGATTGLNVRDCAPDIEALTVRASSQAGILLREGARPSITCSLIRGNGGMGGLVVEGTGVAPRITSTVFDGNTPFDVQSFTPLDIDLSGNHFTADPATSVLGRVRTSPALDAPPDACPNN
ncbi:hypothetical protein GGQ74_001113 [Desulfobaculum xiamenense]|uniref:Fibronectin type-III domain-containing protein n=1 Tax=Desulfobaculum xiamenense TaxID=995050 RepID=A0A846QMK7_9BACT|nr:hypothetical protein [Desulfobaculum xiamenense]NJB67473.1 hypothetical protein [Desulfobaculum xiamenense]